MRPDVEGEEVVIVVEGVEWLSIRELMPEVDTVCDVNEVRARDLECKLELEM